MFYTFRKSKSKRFYQLRFEGFKPKDKLILAFFKDLAFYVLKKTHNLFSFVARFIAVARAVPSSVKAYTVKKLIWSRGRLGRPVANLAIMGLAFIVFLFGEVLNSSKLVSAGEVSPDYLSSVSDIIPNMNTAQTLIPESRKRTEPIEYLVEQGDTLSSIGAQFRISTDALKYVNNLTDSSILKIGQKITIPPVSGLIHAVEEGDTLESIAEKYDVPSQAIADFNYILDTSTLAVGTELVVPGAKVPQPIIVAPVTPSIIEPAPFAQAPPSQGFCVWPTTTRIITQYFSWYHNGLDVAKPHSAPFPPLFACRDGTVTRAGWDPWGLGLHVAIDHGGGYETVYGHMSSINVSYGQSISRGSSIGYMGTTGRSTGPHVHFILKFNGVAQNPLNFTQ